MRVTEMITEREYWIWLTMAFGCANARKWNTLSHYRSVAEACERISGGDMSHVLPQDIKSVRAANIDKARKMIEFCESKKISISTFGDTDFPQRLKEIYNPPSVLFYIGDISGIDDSIVISAVGTRHPSEYSVEVNQKVIAEIVEQGVVIASGYAIGLDSVAHRSAFMSGGKSYAILPGGLLHRYPDQDAGAMELISKRGAVISEYFPADKPTPLSFRARNRILSGIGLGVLIMQAGSGSGALSTASFALSQGRDIFCIPPHDIYDDAYAGVKGLLRDGAIAVFDGSDIINEYNGIYTHKLQSGAVRHIGIDNSVNSDVDKQTNKKTVSKAIKDAYEIEARALPPVPELDGVKKQIYDYIRENGETHLDQLAVGIGDVYELEAFLTELELDGLIRSLPGNRFSI